MFPNTSALRTQFNWTHYKLLIRIDKEEKRAFYIAEEEKTKEGKDLARCTSLSGTDGLLQAVTLQKTITQ